MNRTRCLLLATLAVALLHPSALAAAPRTVSFVGWGGPEERVIVNQVLAVFERANPDLHVKYTQIPGVGYDYFNKVRLIVSVPIFKAPGFGRCL